MKNGLRISREVRNALDENLPVVALESAIVTHGLPKPLNVELALELEKLVRNEGAVPATVGIIDGNATVGCGKDEIMRLGTEKGIVKASVRDLPVLAAMGLSGGTTVASTAFIAARAGISVFVTGGIGGVHRKLPNAFEQNYDISADLPIMGKETILIVSSGAKIILDVRATLEMLETLGVTVLGYKTAYFPGFFVRKTEYRVDASVDSPDEAARVLTERRALGLKGAVLLANPCPVKDAIDAKLAERAIARALRLAEKERISGKELTPFLLRTLRDATKGKTLDANLALVRANARLGARVAVALSAMK